MISQSQILLTGRIAIVTGGAGGIGKGVALGFASFGAQVAIIDKDEATGRSTAAELAELGAGGLFIHADVMDRQALRSAIAAVDAEFGRVDILVNNVGGVRHQKFMDMSQRSIDRHIELNLASVLIGTQEAARIMIREGRGGAIINVNSTEGLRGGPLVSVYAACKAAMHSFTASMALELGQQGIRVNGIAPDQCPTEGTVGHMTALDGMLPFDHPAVARYVPLDRTGTVDDCAGACVFLASDLASYITGVTLPVEGGTLAAAGWNRNRNNAWTLYADA